jgi:hypothetical protein
MSDLKNRLLKLEQGKKSNTFIVCYIPDGEDWDEKCARFRLKMGRKKNRIVFLSHAEDVKA